MKRIAVAGATGLIGTALVNILSERGFEVVIISSDKQRALKKFPAAAGIVTWKSLSSETLEGCDTIVNLAGASVAGQRWSEEYKKLLFSSRIETTRKLFEAVKEMRIKPGAYISSSAVGYYGDGGENLLEETAKKGSGFLADLCLAWENEAKKFESLGVRVASVRTGVVLSPEEGALKKMLLPFKLGIGGHLGSGSQWFPWIHLADIAGIYIYLIENDVSGVFNGSAPVPVKMKEFAKMLGKVMHRPSFFPVPSFVLKTIMGESAVIVLEGQRAVPSAIQKAGYKFKFSNFESALRDLLQ